MFRKDRNENEEVVRLLAQLLSGHPPGSLPVPGPKGQSKAKANSSPPDNPTLHLGSLFLFDLEAGKHGAGTSFCLLSQEPSDMSKGTIVIPILQMRSLRFRENYVIFPRVTNVNVDLSPTLTSKQVRWARRC